MADPANLPPLPADHLDHPEQWATGAAPATGKQKGFVKVLERQHPDLVPGNGLKVDEMGKSEASEIIDQLKNGRYAGPAKREDDSGDTKPDETPQSGGANGKTKEEKVVEELDEQVKVAEKEKKVGEKRKDAPAEKRTRKVVNNGDADDEDSGVGGKDVKRTKQTTLDGVMGSGAGSQGADDEKEDGVRRVKKARVDVDEEEASSPKPEEIPRPTNPIAKEAETEPDLVPPALAANGMNPQPSNGSDTNPGDGEHLDHPENWTTGDEPATDKQKGYLKVLEKQQGAPVAGDVEGMGKSEASGKIEEMRSM